MLLKSTTNAYVPIQHMRMCMVHAIKGAHINPVDRRVQGYITSDT